jgi:hypothetical protein
MANHSIPRIGTHVRIQLFAGDLLAHQGLVSFEAYAGSSGSVLLDDGSGVKIALTGEPAQLRQVLEAALAAIDPPPEPPAVEAA